MTSENQHDKDLGNSVPLPINECTLRENIIWYRIATLVDDMEAIRLDEAGRNFLENHHARNVMIDLSHAGQFSMSAQNIWIEFLRYPPITRTAIYGISTLSRLLASVIVNASRMSNVKMFNTKEEAYKWICDEEEKHS